MRHPGAGTLKPNKLVLLGLVIAGLGAWRLGPWRPVAGDSELPSLSEAASPALRLVLVDENDVPLDCRATLWRVGDGERKIWPGAGGACVDGQLAWQVLEPGAYRLMAQPPGHVLVDIDLEYEAAPIDLGQRVVPVGGVVRGMVSRNGAPVYGAVLALSNGRRHTESGPDGTFAFPGVALGEVVVRAALNGEGDVQTATVVSGEPAELRMELEELPARGVLGLRFEMGAGGALVREIHPGGPAAGLLEVGDWIELIDGVALKSLSRQEVVLLMSGEPGESAVLSVRRGAEVQESTLTRAAHSSL